MTALFAGLAVVLTSALIAQTLLAGMPAPLLLALTVVSVSVAAAYPLATAEFTVMCGACGETSLGAEFGFCLRCGVDAEPHRA